MRNRVFALIHKTIQKHKEIGQIFPVFYYFLNLGSPFLVMIVDTEQELQRFLAGEAPSPQPATPFIPPGWVGPPPPPPPMIASPYPIPLGAPPPHAIMAAGGRRGMPIRGPPPPAMMTAASYGKPSRQHREF